MSRSDCAASCSIASRSGPSPARRAASRASRAPRCERDGWCPCWARVSRDTTRTVSLIGGAFAAPHFPQRLDVHGVGDDLHAGRCDLGRSCPEVRGDRRAHRDNGIGSRESPLLPGQIAPACTESSAASAATVRGVRPDAARHHRRRAVRDRAPGRRTCESGPTSSTPASSRARCRPRESTIVVRQRIAGTDVMTC